MSTILQILASSAVIVVIIEVIFQSRTNRIQFLTSSRAEWRGNLKQYADELNKSNNNNISEVLTKIKVNLNGYGCYNQKEYPSDEQLDFLSDEHIWREIDYIEALCAKGNPLKASIEPHKQKLIQFLALLLKYDWERSKEEIKTNLMAIGAVLTFIIMLVVCLVQIPLDSNKFLQIREIIKITIIMTLPFLILWFPYLLDTISFIRNKKWYRDFNKFPIAWGLGVIIQYVMLSGLQNIYKIDIIVAFIIYTISMILSIFYPMILRSRYIKYDNAIRRIMKIDSLIVYSMHSQFNDTSAFSFFVKNDLNVRIEFSEYSILNDPEFKTYIAGLSNEKELLRFFSYIRYSLSKEKDIMKFVKKKPRRCKMIVRYDAKKPETKTKFSLGFDKKTWREWLQ